MKDNEEMKVILKEQIKMDDGILSKEEVVECIKQLPEYYEIMVRRQNKTVSINVIKKCIDDIACVYPTINLYDEPRERLAGKINKLIQDTYHK